MSQFTVGAGPVSTTRMRRELAPKKRAGIGAQPIDGTTHRKAHMPEHPRATFATPNRGGSVAIPPLTTRKRS